MILEKSADMVIGAYRSYGDDMAGITHGRKGPLKWVNTSWKYTKNDMSMEKNVNKYSLLLW